MTAAAVGHFQGWRFENVPLKPPQILCMHQHQSQPGIIYPQPERKEINDCKCFEIGPTPPNQKSLLSQHPGFASVNAFHSSLNPDCIPASLPVIKYFDDRYSAVQFTQLPPHAWAAKSDTPTSSPGFKFKFLSFILCIFKTSNYHG